MIVIKSVQEIEKMRKAGSIVRSTLEKMRHAIKPGVTTLELDNIAEEHIRSFGAVPSFKGYAGFPASICASVNEVVVHGIPNAVYTLKEGDIIGIDVGAILNGFHGDAAETFPVGNISEEATRLLEITKLSLYKGIDIARTGNRLSDIGHAVQTFVEDAGLSVVRDFVGHGIGRKMHEDPQIPNFGVPHHGPIIKTGMTFAIEPMVNAGVYNVFVMPDNWTVKTKDGKLSAHFEQTVAVTDDSPVILTQ